MTLDKALTEIVQNVDDMMEELNKFGRKIQRQLSDAILQCRIEKLRNDEHEKIVKLSSSEKNANETKMNTSKDIDQQIGALYGCIELRDAIKEAKLLMDTFEGVLKRIGKYVRNTFVHSQIENLFQSLRSFHILFNRMIDKMETMECETFFEELSDIRPSK
ncbi:unnamed protein product [Auanema sp. JU1783]|nr:unnamed protein product [Auanema sp. JU1783]